MARTPLVGQIQRALKIAAYLEETGASTSEGLERIAEIQHSRRRFLRNAAAATAGAAVSLPLFGRVAWGAKGPGIVIVGAGTAGLTCAYRLQQTGLTARVIEASTRVGGRMFTLRNFFPENQITELGGEYIDSNHTRIRSLAQQLGLTVMDLYYKDGPNGHSYYFEKRFIPADADFIDDFRPVAALIKKDLDSMKVKGEIDYNSDTGKKLDNMTIRSWLEKNGADVAPLLRKAIEAAYVGEYGREIDEQSALNLLLEIGEEAPPDSFEIFGDSDERFHIAEGNDSVPTRLAQQLDRPIEFNTRLESITDHNGGYRLSVRREGKSWPIDAEVVVLTIPYTILRKQVKIDVKDFPKQKLDAINELGYGTNAKLIAGFSKRVWLGLDPGDDETRFDGGSSGYTFTDVGFQCCWETSRGQPGTHGILTNFAGGKLGANLNQGSVKVRAEQFVNQVNQVFPGARESYTGKAARQHWPSSPFVLGSYTCYLPGQYGKLSDWVATPVGNVYFAGEHTSVEFNGYMEGAVESGERAALEVIQRAQKKQARARTG